MEMRKALAELLEDALRTNENVAVLNADLARPNGMGDLIKKYPDRVFNVGIAEQNMACVAAGMSAYGFIPFIITFTPFATRRICDQIAVSIAYAKQNVKIIGTDPGISAEMNGGTHMSMEDVGVLRSIPGLVIFEPVDEAQLRKAVPEIIKYEGPVYMRTFRKETPSVFKESDPFDLFKAQTVREGEDATVFCSGIMVYEALKAAEELEKSGAHVEVINVHTIKPIDKESVVRSAKKTKRVVTAENHNIIGGLRSAVCEVLTEEYPVPLKSVGVNDRFGRVGKTPYLKKEYGLEAKNIVDAVLALLKR